MDILSYMTTLATDIRQFQGIRIGKRGPGISHLFFADDSMFFFKASQASCRAVNLVISRFCNISGQLLNFHKSFVKFSPNSPKTMQQQYKSILGVDARLSLGTYLDIPIDLEGSKVEHFTPLLDTITTRITQWNHSSISQSAKVIIINSILIGALMHHLAVFKIPSTIMNKLESILAVFFWKDNQGKGIHWKKRELIQQPRAQGGLGIRNIGALNQALLMKKAWHVKQHLQLLISKIYQRSNMPGFSSIQHIRQSSWGRNGIVKAIEMLGHHSCWKIGNGSTIGVSSHRSTQGFQSIFKDNIPLSEARNLKVCDLLMDNQQGWDRRKLYRFFDPPLVRRIMGMELPFSPEHRDKQFWPYSKSGYYTTKSGYAIFLQRQNEICSMTSSFETKFFRILWGLRMMPKWKLFIWKLWHNGLATKSNLVRRGVGNSSECPICLDDNEDTQHLFRWCPLALEAWDHRHLSTVPLSPHAWSLF